MEFIRISKQKARKLFAEGTTPLYICPVKLRPGLPFNSASLIFGKEYLEKAEGYRDHPLCSGTLEKTAWDLMYRQYEFYNLSSCTNEIGRYAAYYIQKEEI